MLVSIARYRAITGDDTSATAVVDSALTQAQKLLEEDLARPLETGTRTERCRLFYEDRGVASYPSATPLTSVASPAGATIAGHAVLGAQPDTGPTWGVDRPAYGDVTYTGGYDPAETDLAKVTYVPETLARAIARAAYGLLHPPSTVAPHGATSVSVGDVSVSYGPDGATADEVSWPSSVRRWRRQRDLAA